MTSGAFVVYAGRVVTCDPARAAMGNPLGALADAGVLVERGAIRLVGARAEVERAAAGAPVLLDAPASVLTPGLCDAHTHAAFVGSRHDEYVQRMSGASYEAIARDYGASNDIGRVGLPEEVAAMVVFLCSELCSFVVGATVPVDGGTDFF